MKSAHVFLEVVAKHQLALRRGLISERFTRTEGAAWEIRDGAGRLERTWGPFDAPFLSANARTEAERLHTLGRTQGRALELRRFVERLAQLAAPQALEVFLVEVERHVLAGPEAAPHRDVQRWAIVEVRVVNGPDDAKVHERAAGKDLAELLPHAQALVQAAQRAASDRQQRVELPSGELPLVVPPGTDAGALYHELCGHPLEADVLRRGASVFSGKVGHTVGSERLTIVDDPTHGGGCCQYAFDDEGTPARRVTLLDHGKVGEPVADASEAFAHGAASTGHGRRIDYRFAALPRVAHTEVLPHEGEHDAIVAQVKHGLWVRQATPRHVNPLTGEFSFWVDEGRVIRDGALGPLVGPTLFRGEILGALASVDAVGADHRNFMGIKGCSKLDQQGLPVSFGSPTVRFSKLWAEPWR